MRHVKRPTRGLALALLVLFVVALVALPAACDCRDADEAFLCFTPATPSLVVGDSLQITATLEPDEGSLEKCIRESGWRWTWSSDDGGQIELSPVEVQWGGPSEGIYLAQVQCTATQAGTVSLEISPPSCMSQGDLMGTFSCIDVCTITITTTPMMW